MREAAQEGPETILARPTRAKCVCTCCSPFETRVCPVDRAWRLVCGVAADGLDIFFVGEHDCIKYLRASAIDSQEWSAPRGA